MTEDANFLQALLANPADDALRSVYADWLQERGDPRGDYLRLEMQLASLSLTAPEAPGLRRRMIALRPRLDRLWLAQLDQPDVQKANPTPFPASWIATDIPGRPDYGGTYAAYPYATLPRLPVESFRGDFAWLKSSPPWERISRVNRDNWQRQAKENVARIAAQASSFRLPLPQEFGTFLGDVDLMCRVRSCTDCYFDVAEKIAPSPRGEDGHLVRFYADSQGCGYWYLYLTPTGYSCVVSSGILYDGDTAWPDPAEMEEEDDLEGRPADGLDHTIEFCAPSLEAFLYRYWMENEIWYATYGDDDEEERPLTAEQQAYVDHYSR